MSNNWYLAVGLSFDPVENNSDVITEVVEEKIKTWTRDSMKGRGAKMEFGSAMMGKKDEILDDLLNPSIRTSMADEAKSVVYEVIDPKLSAVAATNNNSICVDDFVSDAQKQIKEELQKQTGLLVVSFQKEGGLSTVIERRAEQLGISVLSKEELEQRKKDAIDIFDKFVGNGTDSKVMKQYEKSTVLAALSSFNKSDILEWANVGSNPYNVDKPSDVIAKAEQIRDSYPANTDENHKADTLLQETRAICKNTESVTQYVNYLIGKAMHAIPDYLKLFKGVHVSSEVVAEAEESVTNIINNADAAKQIVIGYLEKNGWKIVAGGSGSSTSTGPSLDKVKKFADDYDNYLAVGKVASEAEQASDIFSKSSLSDMDELIKQSMKENDDGAYDFLDSSFAIKSGSGLVEVSPDKDTWRDYCRYLDCGENFANYQIRLKDIQEDHDSQISKLKKENTSLSARMLPGFISDCSHVIGDSVMATIGVCVIVNLIISLIVSIFSSQVGNILFVIIFLGIPLVGGIKGCVDRVGEINYNKKQISNLESERDQKINEENEKLQASKEWVAKNGVEETESSCKSKANELAKKEKNRIVDEFNKIATNNRKQEASLKSSLSQSGFLSDENTWHLARYIANFMKASPTATFDDGLHYAMSK